MIPKNEEFDFLLKTELIEKAPANKTYKMEIEKERIRGYVDDLDALIQAIYKEINTEKDMYAIYSDYGLKKRDLFGKEKKYAYMILTLRIKECLLKDNRVLDVHSFYYDDKRSVKSDLVMSFVVDSIYGQAKLEVMYRI